MSKDSDPRDSDARDAVPWDARGRVDDVRDRDSIDPRDVFREGLDLPRGRERERVFLDADTFELRGSEVGLWQRSAPSASFRLTSCSTTVGAPAICGTATSTGCGPRS